MTQLNQTLLLQFSPEQSQELLEILRVCKQLLEDKQPDFPFISEQDAADLMDLSPKTLKNRVSAGEMECTKIGGKIYFSKDYLIEYMKKNTISPKEEVKKFRRKKS
jgi:hypothetical protein